MDGVRRRRGAGCRRAPLPHRGGRSCADGRRRQVGRGRGGPRRRVALPRARSDDPRRRGAGCAGRQPIDVPGAHHPLGHCPGAPCASGSSRILHGFSPIPTFAPASDGYTRGNGVSAPPAEARPQMCGVGGCRGTHPLPGPSDPHPMPIARVRVPGIARSDLFRRARRSSTASDLEGRLPLTRVGRSG